MLHTRLKIFILHLGMSVKRFEEDSNISRGRLSRSLKGNTTIASDTLQAIFDRHPILNANWLFKEEETKMLTTTIEKSNPTIIQKLETQISRYENIIDTFIKK